jgi:hypothetical protein
MIVSWLRRRCGTSRRFWAAASSPLSGTKLHFTSRGLGYGSGFRPCGPLSASHLFGKSDGLCPSTKWAYGRVPPGRDGIRQPPEGLTGQPQERQQSARVTRSKSAKETGIDRPRERVRQRTECAAAELLGVFGGPLPAGCTCTTGEQAPCIVMPDLQADYAAIH